MSIQWTFVAGYLYFEVAVVVIMMLPIFSPRRWHQFFKSRLFHMFREHAAVYFYIFLGVLCLFLMDAIREMRKYSHGTDVASVHLSAELKGNVKLFRAQRNFYITGFSIFLTFVIRRLVTMLIIQDELSIKAQRIIKEAEDTVKLAKHTVLKSRLQSPECDVEELKNKLEITEKLLEDQKDRVRELETEVQLWKQKYEEINATASVGKGDE